jgi:hypothetical protein
VSENRAPDNRGPPCPRTPTPACRFSQRSIGLGDGSGSRAGDRPRADPGDSHPPKAQLDLAARQFVDNVAEYPAGTGRAGRAGVTSRVSGARHAASASRTPGRSKAMLVAEAGAQRRGVNTRYVNGSHRHPHDLTTYHWGPVSGCHHRHGGGADQTAAPGTGATRTSTWSRRCSRSAPAAASRTCRAPAGPSRLAKKPDSNSSSSARSPNGASRCSWPTSGPTTAR